MRSIANIATATITTKLRADFILEIFSFKSQFPTSTKLHFKLWTVHYNVSSISRSFALWDPVFIRFQIRWIVFCNPQEIERTCRCVYVPMHVRVIIHSHHFNEIDDCCCGRYFANQSKPANIPLNREIWDKSNHFIKMWRWWGYRLIGGGRPRMYATPVTYTTFHLNLQRDRIFYFNWSYSVLVDEQEARFRNILFFIPHGLIIIKVV